MTLNMVVAGACGVAIPLLVKRLGKDPALVSGIFLTTITDMLGFGLIFMMAIWLVPGI
jgi:magnesium transporter